MKTKFQNEIEEIRVRYESLRKIKVELENQLKKLQAALKDAQDRLIEEQNVHEATRELLNAAEKRNGSFFFSLKNFDFQRFVFLFSNSSWRNRRNSNSFRSRKFSMRNFSK